MMDRGLKANNHLLQLFLVILFLAFVVGLFFTVQRTQKTDSKQTIRVSLILNKSFDIMASFLFTRR